MYEEVFEQNKRLVASMARRYAGVCALDRAVSVEDLTQAGYMALIRAADTYDPSAGKGWVGWARWHILREYCSVLGLRRGHFTRPHTGATPLDRPLAQEDAEGATMGDQLPDRTLPAADEALLLNELRQDVRRAVSRLKSERQRQVVQLCKLEGQSYSQVAERLGVSVKQAYQLYFRASAHLAQDPSLRALAGLDERAPARAGRKARKRRGA